MLVVINIFYFGAYHKSNQGMTGSKKIIIDVISDIDVEKLGIFLAKYEYSSNYNFTLSKVHGPYEIENFSRYEIENFSRYEIENFSRSLPSNVLNHLGVKWLENAHTIDSIDQEIFDEIKLCIMYPTSFTTMFRSCDTFSEYKNMIMIKDIIE